MDADQRPATKIIVFGGSNSLKKGGWVDDLIAVAGDDRLVVNRSIGASTTLMGIYRAETYNAFRPGDVAVWEYAVNDVNRVATGDAPGVLVNHVEWFLKLCRDRGVHVIPVVIPTRRQMGSQRPGPYSAGLSRLFAGHGITPVDGRAMIARRLGAGASLDDLYLDDRHIRIGQPLPRELATAVRDRAAAPDLAGAAAPLSTPRLGRQALRVVSDFPGCVAKPLVNRAYEGSFLAVETPLRIAASGMILGAILKVTRTPIEYEFRAGRRRAGPFAVNGKQMRHTTTPGAWQLGSLAVDARMHPSAFPVEGALVISRRIAGPHPVDPADADSGIVALVIVSPATARTAGSVARSLLRRARRLLGRLRRR